MTVLSTRDNEEFRIQTQVDHSKLVKQMPFSIFSKNFHTQAIFERRMLYKDCNRN